MMKEHKKALITLIVRGIIFLFVGLFFAIGGRVTKINGAMYFGIIWIVIYGALYSWRIVSAVKNLKLAESVANNDAPSPNKTLLDKYKNANYSGNIGYVCFVDSGLKFSARGKFACIKYFNDRSGYHLAFNIIGTQLVCKPDGYDDVLNYEDCLFNIELGYFDGVKLSQPENDNGIVIDDIEHLQGKTIKIRAGSGYVAQIATVECDEIDCGEITFEQWSDTAHVISFKLLASCGVSEVIVGKVNLLEDTEF